MSAFTFNDWMEHRCVYEQLTGTAKEEADQYLTEYWKFMDDILVELALSR